MCCWLCFLSRLGRLSASVGGRRARSVKHRTCARRPSPLGLPTLARSTKRRGNCGGGFTVSASPGNGLSAPLLTCSVSSSKLRYPPRPSSFQRGSWRCLPLASPSTARRSGEALCGALTSPTATRRGGRAPMTKEKHLPEGKCKFLWSV